MFIIQTIPLLIFVLTGLISDASSSNKAVLDELIKMLKERISTDIPAFTAYRDSVQHLRRKAIVKFDKVWTNNLKCYNPTTGVFTAPMGGLYHFSAVVMSSGSKTLFLHLWHNYTKMAGILILGKSSPTGTADVVLKLRKGDTIYLRCRSWRRQEIFSDHDNYITFSGHLIV